MGGSPCTSFVYESSSCTLAGSLAAGGYSEDQYTGGQQLWVKMLPNNSFPTIPKPNPISTPTSIPTPTSPVWKAIYTMAEEHPLVKGTLLTTLPIFSKEWRVTHGFKPTAYIDNWSPSIHLTRGNGTNLKYGDRTLHIAPSSQTGRMKITSSVNGNKGWAYNAVQPPLDVWTNIAVSQTLEGGKYMYRITIGDQVVRTVENTQPLELQGVKVYASDPWFETQPGYIRNLVIETRI